MSPWNDKVAVVTGGSAGLGLKLAGEFVRQGSSVVLAARNEARLREACGSINAPSGSRVLPCPTDITDQSQVDVLVAKTQEEFGHVDVLVNCAGKSSRGEVLETKPDEFQDLLNLNFLSLVRCTRAFMPQLLSSKGHVVNIGSLASKSASRYLGAYPASKFPVVAYSQQLRLELAHRGVHVLLVCPGPIARDDSGQRYENTSVPKSSRQPGGGVKLKGIDPEELSRQILIACEKRKPELVIPAKAKLLFAISQLSASWGDWLVRKMTS